MTMIVNLMDTVRRAVPVVMLAICCLAPLSGQAQAREATTLHVPADGQITVSINGRNVPAMVSSAGGSRPVLSTSVAESLGVERDLIGGMGKVGVRVGPEIVLGHTGLAKVGSGTKVGKGRVVWFDQEFQPGHGVVYGPAALDQDRIVFPLRAPQAGERVVSLPMSGGAWSGTFVRVGSKKIFVTWDTQRSQTISTAAAAQVIAEANGGALHGDPTSTQIVFGVKRPTRNMILATPLAIGGASLSSLLVRTADNGDISSVPDADVDTDVSEIVVTAKGKESKNAYTLHIGRDGLTKCSSITFDKKARKILLSCL